MLVADPTDHRDVECLAFGTTASLLVQCCCDVPVGALASQVAHTVVRGGGDPELAREWLERAQRSWRRANAGTFDEEKWEALEATVYRALRALLAARGGCARPPREIERLWAEATAADEAMPGAAVDDLRRLGDWWSVLVRSSERDMDQLWRRLSETTRALLDYAEARMPAVSAATEPLPRPPVDPGRAVAGWAPAERKWLAEFVAAVRTRHAEVVQDVIVYGSKARGDWHDDSDIDVLVIVAASAAERREALSNLPYDLSVTANALPAILTRIESEWRQLGKEDSPLRRGIERGGFSVWWRKGAERGTREGRMGRRQKRGGGESDPDEKSRNVANGRLD